MVPKHNNKYKADKYMYNIDLNIWQVKALWAHRNPSFNLPAKQYLHQDEVLEITRDKHIPPARRTKVSNG